MGEQSGKEKVNIVLLVCIAVLAVILIALTTVSLVYFKVQTDIAKDISAQEYTGYDRHYVFLANDINSSFWREVYEGAKERGKESNVYLEPFGTGTAMEYSKEECLRMAVASKVDGIILEADESAEIQELINEAVESNVPVVTVVTDCYGSKRQSFIGIGSYNLGREYGRQIVKIATKKTRKVLIIMDGNMDSNTQNIILSGIKETISNEGNHLSLTLETITAGDKSTYGSEEIIRGVFLDEEKLPEIIICMNEQDTINTCQMAVDYNVVGEVSIVGNYVSDEVLTAIERKILTSTVVADAWRMGVNSVDALNEYIETGYVNDYIVMEVETVTANNMRGYKEDAEKAVQP